MSWRRMLNITQPQVGAMAGKSDRWVRRLECGEMPVPRWFIYLAAWVLLYGTHTPYTPEQLPEAIKGTRKLRQFTQEELGRLLGVSRDVIIWAEKGSPRPTGLAFAIAWIRLYGGRLPFPG